VILHIWEGKGPTQLAKGKRGSIRKLKQRAERGERQLMTHIWRTGPLVEGFKGSDMGVGGCTYLQGRRMN